MSKTAIVIPMATSSEFLWLLNSVCLRTLRATIDPAVDVLILGNNTPDGPHHDNVQEQCRLLDIRYHYEPGPFNMARFFNLGTDMTDGEYIVYGSADLIFYPHWLDRILAAYETRKEYFSLSPWGFHTNPAGLGYKLQPTYEDEVVTTHWVCSGIEVMRRDLGYRFDEQFPDYEMDTDYHYWARSKGLKMGIVMNSRVDHLINAVRNQIDQGVNYGIEGHQAKAKADLLAKWGPNPPS